ncbi:MAG: hypothetical protein ACOC5T_06610 [Elusimicrobiota bacterium]
MTEVELSTEHDLRKLISSEKGPIRHLEIGKGMESEYTDLLSAIESAISRYYRNNPDTKDRDVINALKNLKANLFQNYKPTKHPIERQIQEHLRLVLSTKNGFGGKKRMKIEVLMCIKYVLASVKRHHKTGGVRGYLDFIVNYI